MSRNGQRHNLFLPFCLALGLITEMIYKVHRLFVESELLMTIDISGSEVKVTRPQSPDIKCTIADERMVLVSSELEMKFNMPRTDTS